MPYEKEYLKKNFTRIDEKLIPTNAPKPTLTDPPKLTLTDAIKSTLVDKKDNKGYYRLRDLTGPGLNNNDPTWRGYHPKQGGRSWSCPMRIVNKLAGGEDKAKQLSTAQKLELMYKHDYIVFSSNNIPSVKSYLNDLPGKVCQNIWTDIPPVSARSNEYLRFRTQKPIRLLERIIEASSNAGDTVLDPFCGCATTLVAAHQLKRHWIGIDIAYHAIRGVVQNRLTEKFTLTENKDYSVSGIPNTVEGARDLWGRTPYQFQRWVVEYIDGFVNPKKTSDGGVDGRLYFHIPSEEELQTMVLEVKGGHNVGIDVVRNLRGVMEAKPYPMAGLIVLEALGQQKMKNFRAEMAKAGTFESAGKDYPRMQLLTTEAILKGKRFDMPSVSIIKDRQDSLAFKP